jgi:hypothetical protein
MLIHLLRLLIVKRCDTHVHIHLEINDYQQQKDQKLMSFIASKIRLAQES